MSEHDAAAAEITRLEARIEALAGEQAELRARVHDLRTRSDRQDGAVIMPCTARALSRGERIALFRSLFRGREDVFARRWEGKGSGKSGYSPVCANEWLQGACDKPRVKCGDCARRVLLPLDDRVIEDHLLGKQVVGIYPLLPDETCLFLAADFDGKSWRDDVTAFAGTCRSFGLPVEIERSRSGDGAHAWFFFTTALPAAIARKLGSFLLTETMDRRPGIGFKSYDRLFPNQDTMPMGKKARLALSDRLAAIPADEERLLLATGRYVGEGFDDARLDTLFLVMPVSWRGTLVQYAGRIERQHPGKTEVRIIDYADRNVPILAKMFDKRLRGYRKMGYSADPKPRDARLPGL